MTEINEHKPFNAENYQAKQGDIISSDNWNALVNEIKWLGDAKVNRSGDTFKGALTIEEALTVKGSLDIGVTDRKTKVKIEGDLTVNGAISGSINANQINSGILAVDRIPELSADKITSGVLAVERIPELSADKITSGVLAVERIPELSADKITSGKISGDLTIAKSLTVNEIIYAKSINMDGVELNQERLKKLLKPYGFS